jgi:hypothetical protein
MMTVYGRHDGTGKWQGMHTRWPVNVVNSQAWVAQFSTRCFEFGG